MDEASVPAFVAECAKSIATKASCRYRPASVRAVTVQSVGPSDVVVWVVTHIAGFPQGHGPSYRLCLRRVETFSRPICSTESISVVSSGGVAACDYWDLPGNVRDIGLTAGKRALRLPWNA